MRSFLTLLVIIIVLLFKEPRGQILCITNGYFFWMGGNETTSFYGVFQEEGGFLTLSKRFISLNYN